MPSSEELRLLAKVARMYYTDGLRQPEIATRLDLSQARVSRLLKRAEAEGIVRITVTAPTGVFPEAEEALQEAYGLKMAIVVVRAGRCGREQAERGTRGGRRVLPGGHPPVQRHHGDLLMELIAARHR
jgi:DNA-binding transcriptional regulator LsrR (DeoR family)